MIEKSKVKLNLNVQTDETKILPNPEWMFRGIQMAESSWLLTIPGSGSGDLGFSADWSITKFFIGIQLLKISQKKHNSFLYIRIFFL